MPFQLPAKSYTAAELSAIAEALDTLEDVFPGYDIQFVAGKDKPSTEPTNNVPQSLGPPDEPGITNRERVVRATCELASIDEIAAATGLVVQQVRGVVNAPDMEFAKERRDGVQRYKFLRTVVRQR